MSGTPTDHYAVNTPHMRPFVSQKARCRVSASQEETFGGGLSRAPHGSYLQIRYVADNKHRLRTRVKLRQDALRRNSGRALICLSYGSSVDQSRFSLDTPVAQAA